MLSIEQIEADLTLALKGKDQLAADTLRGLKARITNEQIAKQKELSESEITSLVKSEAKRRKEAADVYTKGGRPELAQKELLEAGILAKYLPAQLPEEELIKIVENVITELKATPADFGKVMGKLKASVGDKADGALLAKLLKEKLNT